jgi:hypothetical protein
MRSFPVTFFYPYPDEIVDVHAWDLTDPTPWSFEGKERRRAWIVQTYRWLRHFGYDVDISSVLPEHGVVVLIPEEKSYDALMRQYQEHHKLLTYVTVRADVIEFRSPLADVDVVQNGRFASKRDTFFLPHWPQPGIIPRDESRGTAIRSITFKGGFGSIDSMFRSEEWNQYLRSEGIAFEIASKHTQGEIPRWHDYENADLVLAVRPLFGDGGMRCEKPASKLINAWHAGVPAIVGPEYAFQELHKHPLDYIEVCSVREAIDAVDMLKNSPGLYLDMIEHGRSRAKEFTPKEISKTWAHVLFEKVPQIANRPSRQFAKRLPLSARRVWNLITYQPDAFEVRKMGGYFYRNNFSKK